MRIFKISFFVASATLIFGCSSTPASLKKLEFGEKVLMNIAGGHYQNYDVYDVNDGRPIKVAVTLLEPHATTQWSPSVSLCARGESRVERSCFWLVLSTDSQTIYASAGGSPAVASKNILPYRSHVGKPMAIALNLQPALFSVEVDGTPLITQTTGFEIKGYSFSCISAACSFDFSE